jgi:hypothetical protein
VPVIRDVCATCNNGILSELDSYGANLADRYFNGLLDPPIDVRFECDTERFLRWLLKLLFNDARATSGASTTVYEGLRPFILGETESPSMILSLLIGVIEPFREGTEVLYPEHHGLANFDFSTRGSATVFNLYRGVFLNSYVFAVLGWRPEIPRPTRRRVLKSIMEVNRLSELQRPRASVRLTAPCMNTEAIMLSTVVRSIRLSRAEPPRRKK